MGAHYWFELVLPASFVFFVFFSLSLFLSLDSHVIPLFGFSCRSLFDMSCFFLFPFFSPWITCLVRYCVVLCCLLLFFTCGTSVVFRSFFSSHPYAWTLLHTFQLLTCPVVWYLLYICRAQVFHRSYLCFSLF